MAKILVREDEYQALKKAVARPRSSPPPPPPLSEETEDTVPEKLEAINKHVVVDQENREMREVAQGEGDQKHAQKEEKEESYNLNVYLSFLPPRERANAKMFIKNMILHPGVDIEDGAVYVMGKRAGHIFLILQHFFGNVGAIRERDFLARFLPPSVKKKKKMPATKAAAGKEKKKKKKKEKKPEKDSRQLDESVVSLLT